MRAANAPRTKKFLEEHESEGSGYGGSYSDNGSWGGLDDSPREVDEAPDAESDRDADGPPKGEDLIFVAQKIIFAATNVHDLLPADHQRIHRQPPLSASGCRHFDARSPRAPSRWMTQNHRRPPSFQSFSCHIAAFPEQKNSLLSC